MSAFSPLSSITSVSELTADSPASNFHESDPIHSSQPGYGTDAEHDDEDDQSTVPAPHKHDSTSSGTDSLLANPHGSDSSSSGIDEHAAAKTASWVSVFFLITTDILGPTSAPYAVSQLGYVPGIILFSVMGVIAGYTGLILWHLYLHLDRPQTPIRNFSALTGRIFGSKARVITNWLQSIQLLFNVSVIILGNAQGLSQIFNGKICFSVLALLWASWGMLLGQIKSLKNFTHLSNMAIWMNFLVIFITMAVIPNSEPNYASALAQNGIPYGPVETAWFIQIPFTQQVVGVCQIVYSFGGQLMFIELIAEMKNPRDFIKAALSAQTVILVCYLTFGVFCYHYQGQFILNPANQGISNYLWQTVTNVLNLVSALIAAGLYSNVALKVIYQTVIVETFKGPKLIDDDDAPNGSRLLWVLLCVCYWMFAFAFASAIPQFSNVSGLIAALAIMQFTYTFPLAMALGYQLQRDAIALEGSPDADPDRLIGSRGVDSWRDRSWWGRALATNRLSKFIHFILFLASCVAACLGVYSSIYEINQGFEDGGSATSFGCTPPV